MAPLPKSAIEVGGRSRHCIALTKSQANLRPGLPAGNPAYEGGFAMRRRFPAQGGRW